VRAGGVVPGVEARGDRAASPAVVGADDAAQAKLATGVVGQGEHDIGTLDAANLLEDRARAVAEPGARYLVNPSNDTWIPGENFADLQFDIVSLRAIEQRRTLVRVSTSAPSAIVDSFGRALGRTKAYERGMTQGVVRPQDGRSVYGHIGNTFALACAVLALAGWAAACRRDRRVLSPDLRPQR